MKSKKSLQAMGLGLGMGLKISTENIEELAKKIEDNFLIINFNWL